MLIDHLATARRLGDAVNAPIERVEDLRGQLAVELSPDPATPPAPSLTSADSITGT